MIVSFGTNTVGPISHKGPLRFWDCGVEWARLQPAPNVWDWSRLDALVEQAGSRQTMLVLGHPAAWAAKGGSDGLQAEWMPAGSNRPPRTDSLWANYVVAVAQRYKGRIDQYQIWNEPVDKRFYTGTYAELAYLTKRARSLIARTDPTAKVVSPPLQPRTQAKWDTKGLQLYAALAAENMPFDIWSAHIYPQIGEGTPAWQRDVLKVRNRIGKSKPLWITETNFNVGGTGNPYSWVRQNEILDNVRLRCYTLGVPKVFWYGYGHSDPSLFAITKPL